MCGCGCVCECVHVCACHLALLDTCSGRPCPALRPALGQRGSARLPTSAPAAETDLPCVCLKGGTWVSGRSGSDRNKQTNKQKNPSLFCCTFLLAGGLGLPVGKISQLHLPVDPREVAVPGNKNTQRNHSRLKPVEPSFTRCAFQD